MLLAFSPNLQKRWTTIRSRRGLSAVNDCSAHDWGQTAREDGQNLLTFHGNLAEGSTDFERELPLRRTLGQKF